MICIEIPGINILELKHLVLDDNGTLALDGNLMDGVRERIEALAKHLQVHVVTADESDSQRIVQTFGTEVADDYIPDDCARYRRKAS